MFFSCQSKLLARKRVDGRAGRRPKFEVLEPRFLLAAEPIITELMADNDGFLLDEDGESRDWIEVTNQGDQSIDLDGWFLTDNPADLNNWAFPSTTLGAGESIVLFASGKDRAVSGSELHTDFQLDRHGEHVLLVQPDGMTIASELSPFPFLPENVSYGISNVGERGYFTAPTPGAPNGGVNLKIGAIVVDMQSTPVAPTENDDLVITAEVDLTHGVPLNVTLFYRVMYGGETSLAMLDNGAGADATAGDGIYTATIPSTAFSAGEMVRWYVNTQSATFIDSQFPVWDPAVINQLNAPQYFGTMIAPDDVTSNLPVFYWFLEPGTENDAQSFTGTRASLFYNGEFYDNVFVRKRGNSSAALAKNSFKFDFNQGYHFRFDPEQGRVSEINLNTTFTDKAYVRQNLGFEVYDEVGTPGPIAFPMRVERNSDFFSVAMFVEQPDEDFLDREGLDPNGALYKMFNAFTSATSDVDKRTRKEEPNTDLEDFINGMDTSGNVLRNYAFDNVNLPAVMNYLVGTVLTQNNDQQKKNYFLYRDSDGTGEWLIIPWDIDLTWGRHFMTNDSILDDEIWADEDAILAGAGNDVLVSPSHPYAGEQEHPGERTWNRLIDKLFEIPEFREMYLRRLRTAMDQILQAPGTATNDLILEGRLDDLVTQIGADATLDFNAWADPWSYGQNLSIGQAIEQLKEEYLAVRRAHLYQTHSIDNLGQPDVVGIPHAQPTNATVNFGAIEASPISGNQEEAFVELLNPNSTAIDISGWQLAGDVSHTFAPGTVIRAGSNMYVSPNVNAFRSRATGPTGGEGHFVQGNYSGTLSTTGEEIRLLASDGTVIATVGTPTTPTLTISELHYNPNNPTLPDEQDQEFIEILNIGSGAVDLTGIRIAEFASTPYVFASGLSLAPGETIVVARSPAVFESVYGTGINLAAVGYSGASLSNGGETIALQTDAGADIVRFTYDDLAPWPTAADGTGPSLEIIDPFGDPADPTNWRDSVNSGGSPGFASPLVAGDYDRSGLVDEQDYTLWVSQIGSSVSNPGAGADGNLDGIVNAPDYVVWRDNFGEAAPLIAGDYDRSGLVDSQDHQEWVNQYGTLTASPGIGADGNLDGEVDAADYVVWRENLGASQPVSLVGLAFSSKRNSVRSTAVFSAAFDSIAQSERTDRLLALLVAETPVSTAEDFRELSTRSVERVRTDRAAEIEIDLIDEVYSSMESEDLFSF